MLSDIGKATAPDVDIDNDGQSESVASALIDLVIERGELFFDEKQDWAFVAIVVDGVEMVFQIGTKSFTEWLSYAYYRATENPENNMRGKSASELAIKQASFVLSGICRHDGEKRRVNLRVATYQDGLVIFLAKTLNILPLQNARAYRLPFRILLKYNWAVN